VGGDSVGEGRWGSGGSRIIDLIAEASRESRGGGVGRGGGAARHSHIWDGDGAC
jgi:hypothetical protein